MTLPLPPLRASFAPLPRRVILSLLCVSIGCAGPPPRSPGGAPDSLARPSPAREGKKPKRASKKRDEKHLAALLRLSESNFGSRTDKDGQARFPLLDVEGWKRVRLSLVKHFTAFQYGEDSHALTVAFVVKLKPSDAPTSAACVQRFEEQARPQVAEMAGRVSPILTEVHKWKRKPLVVRKASGQIDVMFKHHDVALAWTGYPAYDESCMIYAVVIPWRHHQLEAETLREKWITGLRRFKPLTQTEPYRHE